VCDQASRRDVSESASRRDASESSWAKKPVSAGVVYAGSVRPESQADCSQGRALEEVSPPESEPPRGLREVPNDEISVFEGEMPLDSADCDVA
jgi:hypothetical protein